MRASIAIPLIGNPLIAIPFIVIPDAPKARAGIGCQRRRACSLAIPALRFVPVGMTADRGTAAGRWRS